MTFSAVATVLVAVEVRPQARVQPPVIFEPHVLTLPTVSSESKVSEVYTYGLLP